MQAKDQIDQKHAGLSIFQQFLILFLGMGFLIISVMAGGYFLYEQNSKKEELKAQFVNSLKEADDYFNARYASQISNDLHFIERSDSFRTYLSSQKEETLINKPSVERLFLYFTDRPHGIYLSARFIDARGDENIITEGGKRVKKYFSGDNIPPDNILYPKIYILFRRLMSEQQDKILVEGPFEYEGKYTFIVGMVKSDPEVEGTAGVVIFHCDITDFLDYLKNKVVYNEHVASLFTLDGKPVYVPAAPFVGGNSAVFYTASDIVNLGPDNKGLFKIVLSLSSGVFLKELLGIIKETFVSMSLLFIIVVLLAFFISRRFSKPLDALIASVRRIATGDLTARVNVIAKGELGSLVDSFNNMAGDLQEITVSRDELTKAKDTAEQALAIKEEFTSMVSHELRTPLAAIKSSIDILDTGIPGKLTDDQKVFIKRVKSNIDRLARLINDVLDFSKLESSGMELDFLPLRPEALVQEVVEIQGPVVKAKGLKIETKFGENLPTLMADKDRLIQVLNNLISNALKFTQEGGIVISVYVEDQRHMTFSVRDTGVGIKEEDLPKLFQKFQQVGGHSQHTGGSGLGLSICKQIITKHNGRIWVESQFGRGSVFYFSIPI